jgi:hypothetical protein
MHLQQLAEGRIEGSWQLGDVYLMRDFVSDGSGPTSDMLGFGNVDTEEKTLGLQQTSRLLD